MTNNVTIDLDTPTRLQILQTWNRLEGIGTPQGRVSSSGNGVHIRVEDAPEDMHASGPKGLLFRLFAGDDKSRVYVDGMVRRDPPNVAFDHKPQGDAGRWVRNVEELISELVAERTEIPKPCL